MRCAVCYARLPQIERIPPIIIHTRLSRYERAHAYQLANNARGEMIGRHLIHSKEDIDRRTKEWVARASLPAAD